MKRVAATSSGEEKEHGEPAVVQHEQGKQDEDLPDGIAEHLARIERSQQRREPEHRRRQEEVWSNPESICQQIHDKGLT